MIEEELQDRMRAAVADEPPLGFDPDELVDRASRRRRRSTLAAVGATGGVLTVAVAAVLFTGMPSEGTKVGTTVTTAPTVPIAPVCTGVEAGTVPPLNFPGSEAIVARLDEAAPRAIAAHLPGVSVQPPEAGMLAYDCPPNVGNVYPLNGVDQRLVVYVVHARDELDLAHDQYAGDANYRLVGEETAPDGALLRTYENARADAGNMLVVVRFGPNGVITEAMLTGQGPLVVDRAALTALASDPELRF